MRALVGPQVLRSPLLFPLRALSRFLPSLTSPRHTTFKYVHTRAHLSLTREKESIAPFDIEQHRQSSIGNDAALDSLDGRMVSSWMIKIEDF